MLVGTVVVAVDYGAVKGSSWRGKEGQVGRTSNLAVSMGPRRQRGTGMNDARVCDGLGARLGGKFTCSVLEEWVGNVALDIGKRRHREPMPRIRIRMLNSEGDGTRDEGVGQGGNSATSPTWNVPVRRRRREQTLCCPAGDQRRDDRGVEIRHGEPWVDEFVR